MYSSCYMIQKAHDVAAQNIFEVAGCNQTKVGEQLSCMRQVLAATLQVLQTVARYLVQYGTCVNTLSCFRYLVPSPARSSATSCRCVTPTTSTPRSLKRLFAEFVWSGQPNPRDECLHVRRYRKRWGRRGGLVPG